MVDISCGQMTQIVILGIILGCAITGISLYFFNSDLVCNYNQQPVPCIDNCAPCNYTCEEVDCVDVIIKEQLEAEQNKERIKEVLKTQVASPK